MTVLKFFVGLAGVIASLVLRGLVLSGLWNWFVPLVANIHTIGIAEATGLSIVATLFTGLKGRSSKDEEEDAFYFPLVVKTVVTSVIHSLFLWGFGYVVHLFL